jgi:hypothetical protein
MTPLDLLSLSGAAAITVAFVLGRFGEAAFVLPSLAIIVGSACFAVWSGAAVAPAVLLVAGLGLYFFGLVILRVMLHRSVSLHMLAAYRDGNIGDTGREDIRGRIADLERYRLAAAQGGVYGLTAFGRTIAGVVTALYRATNVEA